MWRRVVIANVRPSLTTLKDISLKVLQPCAVRGDLSSLPDDILDLWCYKKSIVKFLNKLTFKNDFGIQCYMLTWWSSARPGDLPSIGQHQIKKHTSHFITLRFPYGLVNDVSTLLYWVSHLSVGFNKTHLAKFMRKSLTLMENVLIFTTWIYAWSQKKALHYRPTLLLQCRQTWESPSPGSLRRKEPRGQKSLSRLTFRSKRMLTLTFSTRLFERWTFQLTWKL